MISARYYHKCVYAFALQILMKLEFSRKIFEKYLNVRVHENPSSEGDVFPRGWTDGRTIRQRGITKIRAAFLNFVKTSGRVSFHSLLKRAEHKPTRLDPRLKSNDKVAWTNFVHNLFPMYILLEHHSIFQKSRIIRITVQYILYLSAHIQPSFLLCRLCTICETGNSHPL